jgi:polyhydroxyalkanoate synthesis regulator phasin
MSHGGSGMADKITDDKLIDMLKKERTDIQSAIRTLEERVVTLRLRVQDLDVMIDKLEAGVPNAHK